MFACVGDEGELNNYEVFEFTTSRLMNIHRILTLPTIDPRLL